MSDLQLPSLPEPSNQSRIDCIIAEMQSVIEYTDSIVTDLTYKLAPVLAEIPAQNPETASNTEVGTDAAPLTLSILHQIEYLRQINSRMISLLDRCEL